MFKNDGTSADINLIPALTAKLSKSHEVEKTRLLLDIGALIICLHYGDTVGEI